MKSSNTYEQTNVLFRHDKSLNSIVELSNGILASGSKDKLVKIWNSRTG
jgi:WD40 repeat protein